MMWWWLGRFGWAFMLVRGLMMLAFWGALILLAVLVVRALSARPRGHEASSALEVLKARYARGEITKAEYEEIKREITS